MEECDREKITSCLNLMRRLPPGPEDVKNNLEGLLALAPDCSEELLQRVDQPLEECIDPNLGREYLLCEYNRDEESYRSPWSNEYYPPLEGGYFPSDDLRKLEIGANELLDAYRDMYYEGGVCSVYLWDVEGAIGAFAGSFLIKKKVGGECGTGWQSIHIVQVEPDEGGTHAAYSLSTTIMVAIKPTDVDHNTLLSGNVTDTRKKSMPFTCGGDHLENIGKMIEEMEIDLRRNIDGLYLQKTHQILSSVRNSPFMDPGMTQGKAFTDQLNSAITTPTLRNTKGIVASIPNQSNAELSGQLQAAIGSPNLRRTGFPETSLQPLI